MTVFSKSEHNLLTERVYSELKNSILRRSLAPGKKLDIFKLADQFQVSRTPIKEAFNRLHHEGLIVIKPRKGTYVAEINMKEILEIFDARILFETWAARIGVFEAKERDFQILRELCRKMDHCYLTTPFDFSKFNELDIQFHHHIVQLGKNQRILELYKSLNAHRISERAYYETAYEKAKSGHYQHHEIVAAFENRDLDLLLNLLTNHITAGKEGILHRLH
ncbi:GntR family transcriptional regulator [Cohnella silvisoli]|uniref:GntR family transcriptional regulator n=1 Tax=Cohnella silvisoli TaxID=2873699 RepID=A0ABV1KWG0_9BACL|nr:GntR family transcriptional regulator [Cohnella silvisoli]MCD9023528.1 GntR family transcriptional regulator [Cohnella silvisoli]